MEIKFYIIKFTLSRIYFFSQKIYTKGLILFHISLIGGHLVAQDQTYNYVPQTIAFGSCNDTKKDQSIWRVIDETQKDLWIWLLAIVYGHVWLTMYLTVGYSVWTCMVDYVFDCWL